MNNIDPITNYVVSGNQLVDIRLAIGSLIRRLETDMYLYNFAKGGDCHTRIQELKKLLNEIDYSKTRLDNFVEQIEF
jgi:hypothetical protein